MKKRRIIALLAAGLMVFCTACTKDKNAVLGDDPADNSVIYQETGKNLLEKGNAEYVIVYPQGADVMTRFAADELQGFFNEATNVKLQIKTDNEAVWSNEAKYISLGKTMLAENAAVSTATKNLGTSGFIIETEGNSVFIIGDTGNANVYGVYRFLNSILNYEYYGEDCYSLNKNVKEIPLYDYSVVDVPDIEYRCAAYGFVEENQEVLTRFRQTGFFDLFVNINGQPFHNSLEYLPPSVYAAKHPKWYSADRTQLSYTAQGDEKEYQLMIDEVVKVMKENLIAQPDKHIITLSVQDNFSFDNSEATMKITEKYGAASATIILFLNDVNKEIRAWLASEEGKPYDRDIEILFFAYNKAEKAPVVFNEETGEYEGKDGIRCDDGVSVFYAPIFIDYLRSINHPINQTYSDSIKQWKSISNNMFLWTYNGNFKNYMLPYDTFNGIGELYQAAAESGVRWMLNQSQFDTKTVPSGWSALKQYLDSKLAWDSSLNVNTLINNFMDNYFGEASEYMKENFNAFRAHSEYIKETQEGYSENYSCEAQLLKENYWPKQTVYSWYEDMNEAIESIEYLKAVNPERYDTLYKRIANERLSFIWMLVELYEYNTSPDTVLEWKLQFKADNDYIGGGCRGGAGGVGETFIPELYASWGI